MARTRLRCVCRLVCRRLLSHGRAGGAEAAPRSRRRSRGIGSVTEASGKNTARVDLSALSTRQIDLRRRVIALGERAFGDRWQTSFASATAREIGRHIGQAQVSHWISGKRPVPEALVEPLRRLALRLADELERRAAEIRADWAADPSEEDREALAGLR